MGNLQQLQYMMQFPNEFIVKKPKGAPRHKFTPEEDERLRSLVSMLGENNWGEVAAKLGTRSARQCRERFKNYLSPNLKNEPWTEQEDNLLREKYAEYGAKWSVIANYFHTRSDVNIKNRWAQLQNRSIKIHDIHMQKLQLAQAIDNAIAKSFQPTEPQIIESPKVEKDPFDDFLNSCTVKLDWDNSIDQFEEQMNGFFEFDF